MQAHATPVHLRKGVLRVCLDEPDDTRRVGVVAPVQLPAPVPEDAELRVRHVYVLGPLLVLLDVGVAAGQGTAQGGVGNHRQLSAGGTATLHPDRHGHQGGPQQIRPWF